jgi:hypothetical protein
MFKSKKWKILGENNGDGCHDDRGDNEHVTIVFSLALSSLLNKNQSGAKLYHVGGTKVVYVVFFSCDLLLLSKI